MKASEIMKKLEADKAGRFTQAPAANSSAMAIAWKNMLGERAGYMRELTDKERGQISRLCRKITSEVAAKVIFGATRDWAGFAQELVYAKVAFKPYEPDLGVLLTQVDIALRLVTAGWPHRTAAQLRDDAVAVAAQAQPNPWEGMQ